MYAKQLEVKSELIDFPILDPKKAYTQITDHYGEAKTYIFESLAKSQFDSDHSIIGFNPVCTIKIYRFTENSHVLISGVKELCTFVLNNITQDSYVQQSFDGKIIISNKDLLRLLRKIQSLFIVEKKVNGFNFGFTGYFGYDTTWYIEDLPERIENIHELPDIYLSLYQGIINYNLQQQKATLLLNWIDDVLPKLDAKNILELLTQNKPNKYTQDIEVPKPKQIKDSINKNSYLDLVNTALQYIKKGDIYQIQLGHELEIESDISPYSVYTRMCKRNPSPYMYLFNNDEFSIIGASPELFVSLKGNSVNLRPIAGTIKKGVTPEENLTNKQTLINDPKEQAEHIMLVDLCRNDIGRICKENTLQVDKLMYIEEYSHLYHLVSNVSGQKQADMDIYDIIFATFPEGTMTGAPKIRAMEIIEKLETSRRGIYAGAIGMIDFTGDTLLALCIRTTIHMNQIYKIRASAGVVADSIPTKEWKETLTKMQAVFWAVTDEELKL